jgi:excisionase family DNA binding protein
VARRIRIAQAEILVRLLGADAIFDELDEFLAEFPVERSRSHLHREYFLWLQQMSWFNLDLERFRSSPPPDVMSVDEAAEELGVTRTAVLDLTAAGQLEIFRAGAARFVWRARVVELRSNHDGR